MREVLELANIAGARRCRRDRDLDKYHNDYGGNQKQPPIDSPMMAATLGMQGPRSKLKRAQPVYPVTLSDHKRSNNSSAISRFSREPTRAFQLALYAHIASRSAVLGTFPAFSRLHVEIGRLYAELRIEAHNRLPDYMLFLHTHTDDFAGVQHCSVIAVPEGFSNFMQ